MYASGMGPWTPSSLRTRFYHSPIRRVAPSLCPHRKRAQVFGVGMDSHAWHVVQGWGSWVDMGGRAMDTDSACLDEYGHPVVRRRMGHTQLVQRLKRPRLDRLVPCLTRFRRGQGVTER